MNRTENRKRRAMVRDATKAAGLFGSIIATVAFCMWWFPQVDCQNGRQGLEFIERCEADANCTLRPRELQLKETYTRLILKSCPKD